MTGDERPLSADDVALCRYGRKYLTRRKELLVCVGLLTRLVGFPHDPHGRLRPESTFRHLEQLITAEADGAIPSAYDQARTSMTVDDAVCTAALMANSDLLAEAVIDTLQLAVAIRDIPLPPSAATGRDIAPVRTWALGAERHPEWPGIRDRIIRYYADMIRDVIRNPFMTFAFDARWLTADAVGLARGIYEDRAFERMPLLADALMDAGCDDEQILTHCRSAGPHVRGCWVVDLVLDKH